MSEEKKYPPIPPGSYTKDNLPPISPKAQKMLDRIWAREESPKDNLEAQALVDRIKAGVEAKKETPVYKARQARVEAAIKRGDMATAIGIMFGASGYEDK